VLDLNQYVIAARRQQWPADEGLILAGEEPVAAIRAEPWPEVWQRPWPDGALKRPWLWRLFGLGGNPVQSRTVVRRLADGRPLVRLHRRSPVFHRTVGIFDADDRRVGYCRWGFKGSGAADEFAVLRVDHSPACRVRRVRDGVYSVADTGDNGWATVAVTGQPADPSCRVSVADPAIGDGPDGVLLLAAVLVLCQQTGGRLNAAGSDPAAAGPSA
jgi:hypothetical protein